MTTPDPNTADPKTPDLKPEGAWGAVARLLSLQLLAVIAVTAVITGIYALAGRHGDDKVTAGSSSPGTTRSATAPSNPTASTPASNPAESETASTTPPASATTNSRPPGSTHRLKVDVLNQSGGKGTAARTAKRLRALGWSVGRVGNFSGNVSKTTVYYPTGEAKAARELSSELPGEPRVLPRFSTLSGSRLTVILTH
jgi:hypothetical protein